MQLRHFLTFSNISLPADSGERNVGGEEEGETDNNEDTNNDESDIREESRLFLFIRNWGPITGCRSTI